MLYIIHQIHNLPMYSKTITGPSLKPFLWQFDWFIHIWWLLSYLLFKKFPQNFQAFTHHLFVLHVPDDHDCIPSDHRHEDSLLPLHTQSAAYAVCLGQCYFFICKVIFFVEIDTTNLWIHVIENTKHSSLFRNGRYVTKVVRPLDFVVPESVRKLKSNL